MKSPFLRSFLFAMTALSISISSCTRDEDPGPLQGDERDYAMLDFDRLDMGDAFVVTIQQGALYSVHARGDRRNLDDLLVSKLGTTLKIGFSRGGNRDHTTFVTITMPVLVSANLSGATNSTVSGFKNQDAMELILSGASISQLNVESKKTILNLSGASKLTLSGKSDAIVAVVSGASELNGYAMPALSVDADASGASTISILATQSLKAKASGASVINYRGGASVTSSTSGASTVRED